MLVKVNFRIASLAKPVIIVPTFVNGKGPYEFALDTGASVTVLSADLAKYLVNTDGEIKEGESFNDLC